MKSIGEMQPATPFEKFKRLTERLLAVPKTELDEKLKEYEREKKRGRAKGKKKQGNTRK